MAAYGAATSLKNTIQRILQSSRISLITPSPQILQPLYEEMDTLQRVLLKLDGTSYSKIRTNMNALDERIKETIWQFEDILESHLLDQILPQLESSGGDVSFSVDLQSLQQSVDCLIDMVLAMEVEYLYIEMVNMPEEEGEPIFSRIDFGGIESKMVGLSDQFEKARDYLLAEYEEGNFYSLIGMAGVGKTTLAKKVFDDPLIQATFEFRAWVKVGRKCDSNEILRCILAQVDPNTYEMFTQGEDDDKEKLVGLLDKIFKVKKCLIVLDDVWDTKPMDDLQHKNFRILVTTRLGIESPSQVIRLLSEKESKELLGLKVFGEEGFPFQLEKLGEKIAKKCEGLPLMIVTIAEILSKEDKTPECWTEVTEKQHSSVFMDAYDQISEVLFPSYDYLPQYLKMFFLYLGAFPPYKDIDLLKVINQLSAEGFLEPTGEQTFTEYISACFAELVGWYNLILFELNPTWYSPGACRVHSCWQHLCKKEASKIRFLHVLQSCEDDVIENQRRLCAHSNMLFAFEEVYSSIESDCASTTRSLLCLGPHHKYPVPIHAMGFKLLRVLDAVRVRFYHYPLDILKLIYLQYLSLTCSGDIPASISKLFNLQTLIISRYMHIKKRGARSYMPMEIWDMRELQNIEILERDLPTPNPGATLNKLYELTGVSAKSCTREVLKSIPNLKILGIRMELKPYYDDDSNPLSGLGYISEELHNLNILSYFVTNPDMKYEFMIPLSMFPSNLKILHLRGVGYPWKYMNDIGLLLPNLQDLRLEHYAFRGPEWNIELGCFLKLETLVIEDTDLVRWRPQHGSFPKLQFLILGHCYKLKQLDWTCDRSLITTIELVDCHPLAVASAMQLRPEPLFNVIHHSSF